MIIDYYLIREIVKPLLAICVILTIIVAGFGASRYLADAASGLLPMQSVLHLISLKLVTNLEILLPIALYLSVVGGLGRLYSDSEIAALHAAGYSELRLLRPILLLSLLCALIVGCLSVYIRPLAHQKLFQLETQAEASFDLGSFEAGRFYESSEAGQTIFAEKIDSQHKRLEGVFLRSETDKNTQILYAKQAYQASNESDSSPTLVFLEGNFYTLDQNGTQDLMVNFGKLTLHLDGYENEQPRHRRKAVSTQELIGSERPKDIAELQWRLSRPMAALLLGLLGAPMSRSAPRQGKYTRVFVAILVYAVYYNVSALAKTWVEQEKVSYFPGMWWSDALLAILLLVLLLRPNWNFRLSSAK